MSIKVKNRKYYHPHQAESTTWLLGNTGDTQALVLDLAIGTDDEFSDSNVMELHYPNIVRKTSGTPWRESGFDVGDTVFVEFRWINIGVDLGVFTIAEWIILEINNLEMILDTTLTPMPTGYDTLPYQEGQASDGLRFINAKMYAFKTPEALELIYNHFENENADSYPMQSVIDGNETKLLAEQTHLMAPGVWNDLTKLGYQSGMSIFRARIKSLSDTVGGPGPNNGESSLPGQYSGNLRTDYNQLFGSWRNFHAESIPINMVNPLDSSVQSQVRRYVGLDFPFDAGEFGYGLTHFEDQLFIKESLTSYTTDLNIDFAVKIDNVAHPVGGSKFSLKVFEFATIGTIGAGVPKAVNSKKLVQEWANPQILVGQTKVFNSTFSLNVVANMSYSLVLELESVAGVPTGVGFGFAPQNSVNYTVLKSDMILGVPAGNGNPNTLEILPYENAYQLQIDYIISSLFQDLSSFDVPFTPPDYLVDGNSLTDNFKLKAFPEFNNPNVLMKSFPDKTKQLGNTGWFNENFNELPNDFTVNSVQYFDLTGNELQQLDYSIPVKAIIKVGGIQNLGTDERVAFGFAWVPNNDEDFKDNERGFHENTFMSIGGQFNTFNVNTNYTSVYDGNGYDNIQLNTENLFFHVVGNELVAEITFRPSVEFTAFFDAKDIEDRNYVLWISVADSVLVTNLSNRVSLLVDTDQMEKTIPPLGPYADISNKFIEHPEAADFPGVDEYEGFIEDDILCRLPFRIDINEPVSFQRMTFCVQARNVITDDTFELQNYPVDLTQFITDTNGVHQIDFDSTRGFKLESGNNKNWVKIFRDDMGDVGSSKKYFAYFGFKIRWEDWLSRADVPVEFFDNLELNDGFNNDWLHYLRTIDHEIDFVVKIDANVDGDVGQYKNTYKFNFNDYDENPLVSTEVKYFRASDNFEITQPPVGGIPQGVVLNSEFTKVQIDYTRTDASVWVLNEVYAVTTIEIDNGTGQFEHRQLSSANGSEGDNPLIPIPGAIKLSLSLLNSGQTLRTICLVDPSKLEESSRYKITGRVGCHNSDIVPLLGLYEDKYEDKYE